MTASICLCNNKKIYIVFSVWTGSVVLNITLGKGNEVGLYNCTALQPACYVNDNSTDIDHRPSSLQRTTDCTATFQYCLKSHVLEFSSVSFYSTLFYYI